MTASPFFDGLPLPGLITVDTSVVGVVAGTLTLGWGTVLGGIVLVETSEASGMIEAGTADGVDVPDPATVASPQAASTSSPASAAGMARRRSTRRPYRRPVRLCWAAPMRRASI